MFCSLLGLGHIKSCIVNCDDACLISFVFIQELYWYLMFPMTGMVLGIILVSFWEMIQESFSLSVSLHAALQILSVASLHTPFQIVLIKVLG